MNNEEKIIIEISNKYEDKLNSVKKQFFKCSEIFDLKLFQKVINEDKNIIKNIINDISKKYEELNKADFIMFNGSLARHSNIYNSDLDLNIMYKDQYKDILLPVELKINYILSKILEFKGCDRVHSIMAHTPLINNKKPNLINNKVLKYESIEVPYFCRENSEVLLFETCNSSRDYKNLLKYIDSNENKVEEWENNFELIVDYGKYNEFESARKEIKDKKILIISKKHLVEDIITIINEINNYKYLDYFKTIYIRDLKNIIKAIPLNLLYKTLALINFNELNNIKIDELCNNEKISKDFVNSIYYYLWIILRVQIVFEELGYDLSSHSKKKISMNDLQNIYFKYYNCDIISDINNSLIKMFDYMKKSLIKQKGEYYE